MGDTLKEQGLRASDEKRKNLLNQSVAAFKNALEIQTYQHLPYNWAQTINNLAKTYEALKDWQHAEECYLNLTKNYPTEESIQHLSFIYHERLFKFEEAYLTDSLWVVTYENYDTSSVSNYIEKHFTTARFSEAEKLLTMIFKELTPDNPPLHPLMRH
ncbi:MAG: hypothetical protein GY795_08960 [Desulfobacterales bacterium]|nr:hypothetical protein [Desulfobacterales bacterium]